jgi:hypothetical protein
VTHLTPERLRSLLEGTLDDPQRGRLLAHLNQGCEACSRVLEHETDVDLLERLLLAEQAPAMALEPWERQAMFDGLEPAHSQAPPRGRRTLPLLFALAAALLLVVAVFGTREASWDGVKGDPLFSAAVLELRVVHGHMDGDRFELDGRVEQGQQLASNAALLFELESDRAGARYLFAAGADDQITWLAPVGSPALSPAGSSKVMDGEDWTALEVSDLVPPIRLVGVLAEEPLPLKDVLGAWRAGGSDHVRIAHLTVGVAP